MVEDISVLRGRINEADRRIMDLLAERLNIARQIGEYKIDAGAPVRDVAREEDVVMRFRTMAEERHMDPGIAEQVCRLLIKESVDEQAALFGPSVEPMSIAVIGGNGRMGRWLRLLFEGDGHKVINVDIDTDMRVTDCTDVDVAIVSVPIPVTRNVLSQLDGVCRQDTLIFDIASIKSPFLGLMRDMASRGRRVCSVHPMFSSNDRSLYDRNIIICDCGCPEAADTAERLFGDRGANIKRMSAAEHDRYMSYVLGMSHAVNIAFFDTLSRSGLSYDEMKAVASTTFRKSLDANRSVAFDDPVLYHDIQFLNAGSREAWEVFSECVEELKEASLDPDDSDFVRIMGKGRTYFSD